MDYAERRDAATTVLTKISDEKISIKRYYLSGQLKYKAHLNEMPKGLCDKTNGTEITLKDYSTKDGSKDGLASWWYENGRIRLEEHYKDGKPHGEYTYWYENGQIHIKATYKDGKPDGKMISLFKNGQIEEEINYKDGKLDGEWITRYENGKIRCVVNYKEGKLEKNESY